MKEGNNRSCNRCNQVRPGHVGYCPWCGSPEFEIWAGPLTDGLAEAIASRERALSADTDEAAMPPAH